MKLSLISLIMLFIVGCASTPKEWKAYQQEVRLHPFPIMQGLTTDNMTIITVLAKKDENIDFQVLDSKEKVHTYVNRKQFDDFRRGHIVYQLKYTQLSADQHYTLQVLKNERVVDQRAFKTIPSKAQELKFGVVSCMNDHYKLEQFAMWGDYLTQTPDYNFLIGDNVYSDYTYSKERHIKDKAKAHEAMLWRRYIETWETLLLYRTSELTPTLAIWDDHDYGINNGDRNFPYKEIGLKILRTFYPIEENAMLKTLPGAGFVFEWPEQRFVFVDARSFRSPEVLPQGEKETQWGEEQTQKVLSILKVPKPTWLIQGDQFFGGYHKFESFEGNRPKDFKQTLGFLKASPSKVFFVSGDRHLSEMMKIEKEALGYEAYEVTSSAIHARVYPDSWKQRPNPRQMHGQSGIMNYSIISSSVDKSWGVRVEAFGPEMQVLYDAKVELELKKK